MTETIEILMGVIAGLFASLWLGEKRQRVFYQKMFNDSITFNEKQFSDFMQIIKDAKLTVSSKSENAD